MPASAIVDSEDGDEPAGGPRRSTRDRSRVGNVGATSSGLAAIDITTPLEEGEVMPEAKPYVVSRERRGRRFLFTLVAMVLVLVVVLAVVSLLVSVLMAVALVVVLLEVVMWCCCCCLSLLLLGSHVCLSNLFFFQILSQLIPVGQSFRLMLLVSVHLMQYASVNRFFFSFRFRRPTFFFVSFICRWNVFFSSCLVSVPSASLFFTSHLSSVNRTFSFFSLHFRLRSIFLLEKKNKKN